MYTLHIDVQQTRRKRFHHVMAEDDTLLWSGQKLSDALRWLEDQGHLTFVAATDDAAWLVELYPHDR
jgi:hypothetical protein